MKTYLIKNARIVNEGKIVDGDVLISNGRIEKIGGTISTANAHLVDAKGQFLLPGAIDDQVHFREPGLTHKAEIYTESKAAVAGGITSYMEMPNTVPNTLTQELLEEKYQLAANKSLANFSFFMGARNENIDEVLRTNPENVCGVKVFMGSSTGNMLVDSPETLENLFSLCPMLIATHCEDETTVRRNTERIKALYGEDIPVKFHPEIRSAEACYLSSSYAVSLARQHNTRLHVLHVSTEKELGLFRNDIPLQQKKITAEVCIHHLWFDDRDYERYGNRIKWNPAIKAQSDKEALLKGLLEDKIDILATDHAPHTIAEKEQPYLKCPSGGPLVQHALVAMMEYYHEGKITMEAIARKMSHSVAECFQIRDRGYIREGYKADLVLVDPDYPWIVEPGNILAKCGWSPFEGHTFRSQVTHTFVSGHLSYANGVFDESHKGERLLFNR
ncbi:MAG TPA: dihydroorotase [Bacteroidia bacterium]|nr:dihydroorotase [Bacteroidia bacterium]